MARYSFEDTEEALNTHNQQSRTLLNTASPDRYQSPTRVPLNPSAIAAGRYQSPPRVPLPGVQPESAFEPVRAERRHSRDTTAPGAPLHRDQEGRNWGRDLGYTNSIVSNTTPGADNFGEQASGGMAGIAMTVADAHARESGLEAERGIPQQYAQQYQGHDGQQYQGHEQYSGHDGQQYQGAHDYPQYQQYQDGSDMYQGQYQNDPYQQYSQEPYQDSSHQQYLDHQPYQDQSRHYQEDPFSPQTDYGRPAPQPIHSSSSLTPLSAAAVLPAVSARSPSAMDDFDPYAHNPYQRHSGQRQPGLGALDPNLIEDDGDDGLDYTHHNRNSLLSVGNHSNTGSAVALGAGAGGVMGALGGLVGRSPSANAQYGPVQTPGYDLGREGEKSEWLAKQKSNKKKWAWIIGIIVALLVLGGVGGGVAYALISKKNSPSSSSSSGNGQSATSDLAANGDLNKDSAEIKSLLGNTNLHKVFPGVDYTPINCQYPDCLGNPPSQNNVTRDLAVLSQMTNTLRLYGTDCNQTEMVLHAIDQLGLNGTMKVWLGVWQDKNTTTNARQLSQMYQVLAKYGTKSFLGVVVGNEAIFREDLTVAALGTLVSAVKANFTALGYSLPVATSDIGVSWTQDLANAVDYVMANIHPFFAGVSADVSAGWTWSFWQNSIFPLKKDLSKNIISETGWPSAGGTDCGSDTVTTCANGAVAGVTQMNRFMSDFVCQALTNGTQYFMFEAFDEPWKVSFNTAGKEWEDKWGLMDVNRNLKTGITIPDCGGKTVPNL